MTSAGNSDIQRIMAERAASLSLDGRPVDHTVAAVITVEGDYRFLEDTVGAVFRQTVLPGVVIVADCTGRTGHPMHSSVRLSKDDSSSVVNIQIVRAAGARSFFDAVMKGLEYAELGPSTAALWTLHDDSRPADTCLEMLVETRRNTPTAALLGAKQLDWSGDNLHNVGSYAGTHHLETLVVDGEPDQEQYDGRQDVFAVSLAGALIPLSTLDMTGGVNSWFGSFAEADDFCRRICLGGGRVVVVPSAEVAHRRARFEGVRTREGDAVPDGENVNPAMGIMDALQRYRYTDIRMLWWPLLWIWSFIRSFGMALVRLSHKQPYEALCELALPWRMVVSIPQAMKARRQLVRHSTVPMSRLTALQATRRQVAQWHDRSQAFNDQRDTVVLNPLARAHLLRRTVVRWSVVLCTAVFALAVVVGLYWPVFRAAFAGTSIMSDTWAPTGAGFAQLAETATSSWAFGTGTGVPAPPTPWLLVLLAASVITFGHVAAATTLILFVAPPLTVLSFWALAGVFTRSDAVRIASSLLWFALSLALGLYSSANLAMLTVMVFLPAAFAFAFRAVGMYRTEDPVKPHGSVQAAAASALCFIPVVCAEPQLLLPLMVVFLSFIVIVRRHRATLLLIPLPAAIVLAPTLINVVHRFGDGAWRQLFTDISLPADGGDSEPAALSWIGVLIKVFDIQRIDFSWWGMMSAAVLGVTAVLVILSVVALAMPSALRVSRMMWMVIISGVVLMLAAVRIAAVPGQVSAISGTPLPGIVLSMMGLLACTCAVAGTAVKRFDPLRIAAHGKARVIVTGIGRAALTIVMVFGVCVWGVYGMTQYKNEQLSVSRSGLPMVAVDYLEQDSNHRVLALSAQSDSHVAYAVMRTSKGDLIDNSSGQRAQQMSGIHDESDEMLASASARLLADADSQAIADITSLGFGGMYVSTRTSASTRAAERLIANITASDGVQSVVSNDDGTYFRFTLIDPLSQGVDESRQHNVQSSGWRVAWLWCMGLVIVLYCVVACPRRHRYDWEEA